MTKIETLEQLAKDNCTKTFTCIRTSDLLDLLELVSFARRLRADLVADYGNYVCQVNFPQFFDAIENLEKVVKTSTNDHTT